MSGNDGDYENDDFFGHLSWNMFLYVKFEPLMNIVYDFKTRNK